MSSSWFFSLYSTDWLLPVSIRVTVLVCLVAIIGVIGSRKHYNVSVADTALMVVYITLLGSLLSWIVLMSLPGIIGGLLWVLFL